MLLSLARLAEGHPTRIAREGLRQFHVALAVRQDEGGGDAVDTRVMIQNCMVMAVSKDDRGKLWIDKQRRLITEVNNHILSQNQ